MIEIKCAAPEIAAALCAQAGVEEQTVLVMTEREALLGFVCMLLNGEEVTLTYLEAPDIPLTDALLRAALNSARSAGAKTAFIGHRRLVSYMVKTGYLTGTSLMTVEISDFFAKTACKA